MLLALLLPNAVVQDYTQCGLPEGAITRLGKGSAEAILYSPDGTRLAVVSTIGIWLYDTATYRQIALLTGHTREIADAAFSPDGMTLASASWDKTIRLWDTETGNHKETLTGHMEAVEGVVFSPDGNTLAVGVRT